MFDAQAHYDEWVQSIFAGYTQYVLGDIMETWSGRILRTMLGLKYYGWMQVKRNNNLFYSGHSTFHRGIPAGRYRIWANEHRGIFVNPVAAYIVFPGV